MQMPSVITDIEKQLAAGHSVVLQLVNTNAATLERRMEQARSQGLPLDEIDITPRDILMQFLQNSFPVAQYETYTTDDGSERSRVVVDSKGNAVLNPQAVRMRDNLLMKIATIDVPEGPLEQLFNHFGSEAIAEVTGRKERLVRQKDGSMVLEKLSSKTIDKDVEQYNEGKKRILVFSQAGGTGRSYHASRKFKNQQKRVHYLLQAGWEADKAVQGLGRTHRTDQAQPPQYRLVTTNMKAQMRFIATIARRLGQLGALTKGQRDTGSQGIFSEDMNLESEYGRAAIRTLTDDLVAGRVEGITLGEFMDQTAIEFIDSETGEVIESKKPTVQTFMNRLLSLKSEDMNRLFSAFHDRMEAAVAHAKEQGTFDQGMETITADKITKLDDQPVGTGGTRYVKVETENPAQHVEFDMLTPKTEFYRNSKSGKLYGISDALSVTDTKTGRIVQRKRRTSPSGGDYITVEELSKKYMPDNGSVQEHRQEWGEDLAKLSPIRKSNIHMIVGELLPIWDRLPSNQPKIYRMQSDDGEVLLGRVINQGNLDETLTALGLESKVEKRSPEEWLSAVMDDGSTLQLANGWKITKRRVSDDWRLEVSGATAAENQIIEKMGGFVELISYQPRVFLPAGNAGVLGKILKDKPVVSVIEKGSPQYSLQENEGEFKRRKPSKVQLYANILNNYLRDEIGERHGFEQVDVPDTFHQTAGALEAALGRKIIFVQPRTKNAEGILNGVYVKGEELYVSTEVNDIDFMGTIAHEFVHSLEKKSPALYRYLSSKMDEYVADGGYEAHRNRLNGNQAFEHYSELQTKKELIGDFVGDAFSDPDFLQKLAEDNPSKFKMVLNSFMAFLGRITDKLRSNPLGTDAYVRDVDGMRKQLRKVLNAHAKGKSFVDAVAGTSPQYSLQQGAKPRTKGERLKERVRNKNVLNGVGKGVAGHTWKTVKDTVRPGMLWMMNGKQLLEVYGGKFRGALKKYVTEQDKMREEKSKLINRADGIEKRWTRHTDSKEIGEILLDGTYNQLDPLMAFDDHTHIKKKRDELHQMAADARLMGEMNQRRESLEKALLKLESELADLKETHDMLVSRHEDLDGSGKRIYKEVRETYSEGLQEYKRALEDKIERSEMSGKAKLAARQQVELMFTEMADLVAYFPLKRFGNNIVLAEIDDERHVMKFDKVVDAENEMNRIIDEGGIAERHTDAEYLKSENVVTPQFMNDVESMLEGNGLMDQSLRDSLNQLYLNYLPESSARKQFMHRKYVKGFSRDAIRSFSHSMFHGAHQIAKVKFSDKLQAELDRMEQMTNWKTYRLYSQEEPKDVASYDDERVALKAAADTRNIHRDWYVTTSKKDGKWVVTIKPAKREEVGSFSTDVEAREARANMLKILPGSNFVIEPKPNPDLASDLKNSESLAQVVNHMKKRHEVMMNPTGSRLVNGLSAFGFVMNLGFTPAAALVNMSQTGLVAMPQLAARHGWHRAQKALHGYVKDIAVGGHIDSVDDIEVDEVMTDERKTELKRIIDGRKETRFIDKTLATLLTSKKLNNRQRVALMHLYDSGNLDLSQNSDLSTVAHNDLGVRMGGAVPLKGLVETSGYLFHNVEVFNREVTGLAAYDLAYEDAIKAGDSELVAHAKGSEAAVDANDRGHFDYSTENRALLMQSNVARVVTQFKQYSQNMTFRLLRDFHQTFKGESKEDRDIARRQLIGTLSMHAIFAGAAGMPWVTVPMVLQIAGMAMGDDDDPVNPEVELRNYLADKFGSKGAEVIMNGVLRGIPGVSAADVHSRITLNGLWVRDSGWDKEGDSEV
ncbi:PLxRFG domain-containing protein, partial [Candidatus Bathyarchaeota archaeon]|nr:PLxRFG domain-containing protein [Candidatus Bathyarchaeota archaeon]